MAHHAEKLTQMLAGLPEVQALILRDAEFKTEAALKDRLDCMERLEAARNQEAEAKDETIETAKALEAVRTKLHTLEIAARVAQERWVAASMTRNHIEAELARVHGEGPITQALFVLHRNREDAEQRLRALEFNRFERTHGGMFQRERPEIAARIEEVTAHLSAIAIANEGVLGLQYAHLPPAEIAAQVDNLLASCNCKPRQTVITE